MPDVMLALLDYPKQPTHPEFTLGAARQFQERRAQEQFGFRFIGSEGVITTSMSCPYYLTRRPPEASQAIPSNTFPKQAQEEFLKQYRQKYPKTGPPPTECPPIRQKIHLNAARLRRASEHHRVFYEAVRSRKRPVEDAYFGFRAAGPALLSNVSYFERRICGWDAEEDGSSLKYGSIIRIMSEKVAIFDTTLRDGKQAAGTRLGSREKIMVARQLANLNVDVIEADIPTRRRKISRPSDELR